MEQKILITGITGQDGIFLASKLLKKNIEVFGITRNRNLKYLKTCLTSLSVQNFNKLNLIEADLLHSKSLEILFKKFNFTDVYNFSGPSSVYTSLVDNGQTKNEIIKIFENLITASLNMEKLPNFFQASSSEMFGPNNLNMLNEKSSFNPISPYAVGKLHNHNKVLELAKQYSWNIKSGIMFNHESEFRKNNYLFTKVINAAKKIKKNEIKKLSLGSLDYCRDWTFSGDVVDAAMLALDSGSHPSYVIGTGISKSIRELVELTFNYFDLDWTKYIEIDEKLLRKNDPIKVIADPKLIMKELNWQPTISFQSLVNRCISKS